MQLRSPATLILQLIIKLITTPLLCHQTRSVLKKSLLLLGEVAWQARFVLNLVPLRVHRPKTLGRLLPRDRARPEDPKAVV